jgi:hypothetical protein
MMDLCALFYLCHSKMFVVAMDNTHHNYKVLSWNVRGMNNPARQEDLRQITAQFSPDIAFI